MLEIFDFSLNIGVLHEIESSQTRREVLTANLVHCQQLWSLEGLHLHAPWIVDGCTYQLGCLYCWLINFDMSSQLMTITYRLYRTHIQYCVQYFENANNRKSSRTWSCSASRAPLMNLCDPYHHFEGILIYWKQWLRLSWPAVMLVTLIKLPESYLFNIVGGWQEARAYLKAMPFALKGSLEVLCLFSIGKSMDLSCANDRGHGCHLDWWRCPAEVENWFPKLSRAKRASEEKQKNCHFTEMWITKWNCLWMVRILAWMQL
jgi:hypothetical protein